MRSNVSTLQQVAISRVNVPPVVARHISQVGDDLYNGITLELRRPRGWRRKPRLRRDGATCASPGLIADAVAGQLEGLSVAVDSALALTGRL